MSVSIKQVVEGVHASSIRMVISTSGGGAMALADLLSVPGASRTLLEAVVPYCEQSMAAWLGGRPDQFCSLQTARAMAMAAFNRAIKLAPGEPALAGIGCTAGLATDRAKRGEHRAHVAMQSASRTAIWSLELTKDVRTRAEEERLVSSLVLNAVADACGLSERLELPLRPEEQVQHSETAASPEWQNLLLGRVEVVRQGGASAAVIFPGTFNPVHQGHRRMRELAAKLLNREVALEISIVNVDKPPLDYGEIARRLGQFPPEEPVWLSRAATFEEKSRLFPGATFIVGTDTLRRIAAPAYYGNDAAACLAALQRIASRGCRFLVFARSMGTGVVRLGDLELPEPLRIICREVPPEVFREDVSSTEIRRAGAW